MGTAKTEELWGHPKGLYILFFTEMWERFSYYGMRALLVLYLVAQTKDGGFGWSNTDALSLYGWYTMLVYLMSVPGGIIADRYLGQKKSVMVGGFSLVAGHLLMAATPLWAFYAALGLIILGVGMLKPNISTMVGELYGKHDERRDSAFTIFYIGINVGAFLSSLICGYVGEKIGWHYGFALAGIGMLLGQAVFIYGQRHLRGVGDLESSRLSTSPVEQLNAVADKGLTKVEWDRIKVLLISFGIVIVFWAAYEQAGGMLNLYAEQMTNRKFFGFEIPASWFQSLNPVFILVFGGVVASFWYWLSKKLGETSTLVSAIYKMGLGTVIMGGGFLLMVGSAVQVENSADSMSNMWWLVGAYFLHTIGELCLSPVVLSYITRISPKKIVASMMGIYFAATGIANKFASMLGIWSEKLGALEIFALIAGVSIGLGLLLMAFSGRINRLAHEDQLAEDKRRDELAA